MKSLKQLIFPALILLTSSCGKNAFINNANDTQTIQTATEENLEVRYYTGTATSGLNGFQTSMFESELSLISQANLEDFSTTVIGKTLEVKSTINNITYSISHLDDSAAQTSRNIYVESPVSQGGALGDNTGLDFAYGSSTTKNTMYISFNKPIAHFGIDLIDFESSSSFTLGEIVAKDCSATPNTIVSKSIDFGSEDGNSEVHFYGLIANKATICSVQIFVGDNGTGQGKAEKFAVDNMRFGTSILK